ncbi:GNAT family N-acetyltransferase [Microbulbifer aggregans]|uniref:GNAT family N-acetyltransferase n=1 Tax=Microbulbifer aggregans TaxID=1769779 RepID=UPI001CFEE9FC|nr:GNAT family N-acetyltransferase [Microbulbifer aggregans]
MLRPLQESDVKRLLQLWFHLACTSHPSLPLGFWRKERQTLKRQLLGVQIPALGRVARQKAVTHWVYTLPGSSRAEGLVTVTNEGLIHTIFVSPAAQRRGIGSALITQAKFGKLKLEASVLEENLGGRYFLQQHGFVETSRRFSVAANQEELVMSCRVA